MVCKKFPCLGIPSVTKHIEDLVVLVHGALNGFYRETSHIGADNDQVSYLKVDFYPIFVSTGHQQLIMKMPIPANKSLSEFFPFFCVSRRIRQLFFKVSQFL